MISGQKFFLCAFCQVAVTRKCATKHFRLCFENDHICLKREMERQNDKGRKRTRVRRCRGYKDEVEEKRKKSRVEGYEATKSDE